MLYMLSRVFGAKDWGTGIELKSSLLGRLSGLQLHHVFPKARLYEAGYPRSEVNSLANFTFLTQETNLEISDRDPADYLPEVQEKHPGALESHWIPTDPALWSIDRYSDFLEERRHLLAAAGNEFLDSLGHGALEEAEAIAAPAATPAAAPRELPIPGSIDSDEELEELKALGEWITAQDLPRGQLEYELVDSATGQPMAVLDLAWPEGLQPGLSDPVTILIDESPETEEAANHAGFRFFTTAESFKDYVRSEITAGYEESVA